MVPDRMSNDLIAGVEAGGTKILCAVADADGRVVAQKRIATGAPDQTFTAIADFYRQQRHDYGAITVGGIASFGPLDLDPVSRAYGSLTTTPKPGWSGTNMLARISEIIDAPAVIDTDVNCAGLAEARHGAGRSLDRLCYVTVGTGIGVGYIENGRPAGGIGHPEAGHMYVPRARRDTFAGTCPYHGDCLEGLACGPAMAARWGCNAEDLVDDHVGWRFEAHYLASLCVNLTYMLRPQRIILGGGVMAHRSFHARVRETFAELTAGYSLDRCSMDPERFICPPAAEEPSAGLLGALELARDFQARASER